MSVTQSNVNPGSSFNRAEYNKTYYQRNKEKLCEQRMETYRRQKGTKALNYYINTHLDEDLHTMHDLLLETDESDPEQYERCASLMKVAQLMIEIKLTALGQPQEEIERIRNLPIDT